MDRKRNWDWHLVETASAMIGDFKWGTNDCATVTYALANAMYEEQFIPNNKKPSYKTKRGAVGRFKKGGFIDTLTDLGATIETGYPKRGDVVVVEDTIENAYFCIGKHTIVSDEVHGVGIVKTNDLYDKLEGEDWTLVRLP